MKIVIEIPEKVYCLLKYFEGSLGLNDEKDSNDDVKTALMRAVIHGTPLPKNATNRDVINSIFGKYFSIPLATTEEWLDAPYEEVNADGDNN